jgi:hypothetical protein
MHLDQFEEWLKQWRIKANETKSIHITFALRSGICPPVQLNGTRIPQEESNTYLGLYLDRRLTWRTHILARRKQLDIKFSKMYWLIGRKSELTTENKILVYKSILKQIWTYGVPLWETASKSNTEILQRLQNKVLRAIVNAPWYVPNRLLHADVGIPTVREEITSKYKHKITVHPNELAITLLNDVDEPRRLKRHKPTDLTRICAQM